MLAGKPNYDAKCFICVICGSSNHFFKAASIQCFKANNICWVEVNDKALPPFFQTPQPSPEHWWMPWSTPTISERFINTTTNTRTMLINNPNISRHITHKVHAVPRRSDSGDPSLLSSVPIPTKMHQITTEVNNRNPARSFKPILTYPPTSTRKSMPTNDNHQYCHCIQPISISKTVNQQRSNLCPSQINAHHQTDLPITICTLRLLWTVGWNESKLYKGHRQHCYILPSFSCPDGMPASWWLPCNNGIASWSWTS